MRFSMKYLSYTFIEAKQNGERIANIRNMFMMRKKDVHLKNVAKVIAILFLFLPKNHILYLIPHLFS